MELKLVRNAEHYREDLLHLGGYYRVWKIDCIDNKFDNIYRFYIITDGGEIGENIFVTFNMLDDFEVVPCIE